MKKIIIPALVLCLSACGSTTVAPPQGPAPKESAAPQQATQNLARDVKFGETAGATYNSSQFAIKVDAPKDYSKFAVPPEEGKYVSINVEAKLVSGVGGPISAASFTLVDGAGNDYTFAAPNGTDTKEQMFETLLGAGATGSGIAVFDVPKDAKNLVVKYIPVSETKDFASWS
jgi:hypothetical protein